MDGKKLRSDYHVILEEYRTRHPNIDASLCYILSRGVYNGELCKHGGILISGINPSYDGKAEGELPCNRLTECIGKYWKPYVEIANSFSEDMVGYLDVFPLRCTKEADLLKIVPVDLKVSLIQKFMQVVEDDITECDREIERLQGFLRVIDDKEDVIRILRHSTDGYNAVLQLVKEKYLTKLQAEAITNITFSQFAGLERNTLKQDLGDERKLRDFLVRLRI